MIDNRMIALYHHPVLMRSEVNPGMRLPPAFQ